MSSLWDAFTGRRGSAQQQPQPHQAPSSPPGPAESHADTSPPSHAGRQKELDGDLDLFTASSFADPTQMHILAGLDKHTLDYITLEDSTLSDLPGSQSVLPSRGFTDDLCYGTGLTYLSALTLGGAWGLQEGLRRSANHPPKLRLNSVLNAVTRRGPFLGNSAGVIAITYNCINSFIGYLRGKHDAANTIAAGALSGMVFKSTQGLRPMAISGGMVASVAGLWAITRRTFFSRPEREKTPIKL